MSNSSYLATLATVPTIALVTLASYSARGETAKRVDVTCAQQDSVPTVIATFSNLKHSQVTPILSFLPEYFSPEDASGNCEKTAQSLQMYYTQNRMNYLASDTIDEKPVVCAVERRGLNCNSYGSEILFALTKPVSPTELLYNMLNSNFKGSQPPSSRTVSRIYTDLRPSWWPLPF